LKKIEEDALEGIQVGRSFSGRFRGPRTLCKRACEATAVRKNPSSAADARICLLTPDYCLPISSDIFPNQWLILRLSGHRLKKIEEDGLEGIQVGRSFSGRFRGPRTLCKRACEATAVRKNPSAAADARICLLTPDYCLPISSDIFPNQWLILRLSGHRLKKIEEDGLERAEG
jgi:hypothetical protein